MFATLAVLTALILLALVVLLVRTPAKSTCPTDRIAQHVEANRAGLESAMTHTPGSWAPVHRTDAAAVRLHRSRQLNLENECAARAI